MCEQQRLDHKSIESMFITLLADHDVGSLTIQQVCKLYELLRDAFGEDRFVSVVQDAYRERVLSKQDLPRKN